MRPRWSWLLAVSLLGASCGNPTGPSVEPPQILPITPSTAIPPYNRDAWHYGIDADNDCQDTRAEVLIRDSQVAVTFRPRDDGRPCVVDAGQWVDPYSGQTFTRASDLEIDHFVPLANAHRSGGWAWASQQKEDYANDLGYLRHLLAVSAALNRQKSDKGPEEWMPPNVRHRCTYGQIWLEVKVRWHLTATPAEASALEALRASCGAQSTAIS